MVSLDALVNYLDDYLEVKRFEDYCPNGLQVEGRAAVGKVVSGVTACLALLDAALAAKADLVLVHHGYFWRGEDPRIVGIKRKRLQRLLENDVSLLAYHLPLDAHPRCGNNATLAERLGLESEGAFDHGPGAGLALYGRLRVPVDGAGLAERIGAALGRPPLHIAGNAAPIERIGWCTGAAQGFIDQAATLGLDAYLSGEVSEPTVHVARENGLHYFGAGHHATERYGVQALGEHIATRFDLAHEFIDIDNPA